MQYSQEQLMREIQKVGFAVVELNLYLDTHPTDRNAFNLYNQYSQQLKTLKEMYSRQFGPIDGYAPVYQYPYAWITTPWPWERKHSMLEEAYKYVGL